MIRLKNITMRHAAGRKNPSPPALSQISLHIASGEMTGLLGPNGSGKTTLLRTISGSLKPETGRAVIFGDAVRSLSHKERARRMAFVPQRPENVPEFTVFDIVLMGRYAHRKFLEDYTPEDEGAARAALAATATEHLADRPARTLSGGELQRVYAARAFAQETPLLLLDEPATGLDPAHAAALMDRVRARNKREGTTVLMAIHDLNLAALYCDRLFFLKQGQIAADGPVRDVFTAQTLRRVYEAEFCIIPHPETGLPQALPVPGQPTADTPRGETCLEAEHEACHKTVHKPEREAGRTTGRSSSGQTQEDARAEDAHA